MCHFVFSTFSTVLYCQDAETHGNGKVISANIAMHEKNNKLPKRGSNCLRYIAATSDDSSFLLNQVLYKVRSMIRMEPLTGWFESLTFSLFFNFPQLQQLMVITLL